jgi:hypothetical protein
LWSCTVILDGRKVDLGRDESSRIKLLFERFEAKLTLTGTTEDRILNLPRSRFTFISGNSDPIEYSFWDQEEPFTVEVRTGKQKSRRLFFGDKELKMEIQTILDRHFSTKQKAK